MDFYNDDEWRDLAGPSSDSCYFSVEVHHGGRFCLRPRKVYIGGKTNTFHGLHEDYLSLLEMDAMYQKLRYTDPVGLYYKKPGFSLDNGLVHVTTDAQLLDMLKFLHKDRVAILYLDHEGGQNLVQSQVGSSNFFPPNERDPHKQTQSTFFDVTLETTDDGVGPCNIETEFGFVDLDMDSGFGLDMDYGLGPQYVTLNEDIPYDDLGFEEADGIDLEEASIGSDSSADEVYYSDHSYIEEDDDELYETYVDGIDASHTENKGKEKDKEVYADGDEGVLSDGDDKYDSDNNYYSTSDEDNGQTTNLPFKHFKVGTDMEDPHFSVGMLFGTSEDLKKAVKQYAINNQRPVKLVKNDKRRIRAKCLPPCKWELYAAKVLAESSYQIRTFNCKHTCIKTYSNRNVTSTLIAKKYMDDLRTNPRLPITAFKERVRKELKVDVSRNQLYRAKKKAAAMIYGTDIEQYARLWDYCQELRRSNPGSTVVMDAPVDEEIGQPRFNRLYIFLGSVKFAFLNGCRKIIGVDGCHLKGDYSGQILTAVGVDPNNAMYPMAWAVVEKEDKDTWGWFITLLMMDCNITSDNEHEWTFINDRQKGLLPTLNEMVPRAEHRYCCKHILANFQNRFKGVSLEDKFWECSKASHPSMFDEAMVRMKEENEEAYNWLADIHPRYWTRSHFSDRVKCDMVCNNLCEAFNRAILEARDKPIIEMLEWIRCYLSRRMLVRREWIRNFTNQLLPNIHDKLETIIDESGNCYATWFGDLQFQVKVREGEQYTVDLTTRTCSCRRWDLSGIPCPHAIAAIQERHQPPEDYLNPCYSKASYKKAYDPLINPINGFKLWPKTGFTPVVPPAERRKVGRPRMKRIRGPEEYINPKYPNKLRRVGQNSVFCRRCGNHGHNRRTCNAAVPEQTETNVRGRGGAARGRSGPARGRGINVPVSIGGEINVPVSIGGEINVPVSSVPVRGRGRGVTIRGRGRGVTVRGRGRGRGVTVNTRGGGTGVKTRGGGTGVTSRGGGTGVKTRGGGTGVTSRGGGTGVNTRGGGTGVPGRGRARGRGFGRGGGHGNQVNTPANYAQATQGSQLSAVTQLNKAPSTKYGNVPTLHGVRP